MNILLQRKRENERVRVRSVSRAKIPGVHAAMRDGCAEVRAPPGTLENKVFSSYQGSWGESTADRLLWLPSVSILGAGGVNAWGACPSRVERSGVREDRRRVSGAWRVWPGVTQRRAGQIEPGTDSSSSSSVHAPPFHGGGTLRCSQAGGATPLLIPLRPFNVKAHGAVFMSAA